MIDLSPLEFPLSLFAISTIVWGIAWAIRGGRFKVEFRDDDEGKGPPDVRR